MAKKDFTNPALDFITQKGTQGTQYTQRTQDEPPTQDTQGTRNTPVTQDAPIVRGTQGKKGHKLPRINMAFTRDNLDHLQLMARIEGVSITEYVNRLVKTDQANQASTISRAKEILKGAE